MPVTTGSGVAVSVEIVVLVLIFSAGSLLPTVEVVVGLGDVVAETASGVGDWLVDSELAGKSVQPPMVMTEATIIQVNRARFMNKRVLRCGKYLVSILFYDYLNVPKGVIERFPLCLFHPAP